MLGNPGQPTGFRPPPEPLDDELLGVPPAPVCLPAPCVRTMNSFRMECPVDCPGRQRDGTCLTDPVKEAADRGMKLLLELDRDGYWVPAGEERLP